jgi:hypothetical protein
LIAVDSQHVCSRLFESEKIIRHEATAIGTEKRQGLTIQQLFENGCLLDTGLQHGF